MCRFDDYLLWKSEFSGQEVTGLGPERAFLVSARPLSSEKTRYAVVGQSSDLGLAEFRRFRVKGTPPVFLVNDAVQIERERLLPAFDTLFAPHSLDVSLRALVSSRAVISFTLVPAIVAIAHRIPAIVISSDPKTLLLTERLGIPCLKRAPAVRLLKAVTEIFENYCWDVPFLSGQIFLEKLKMSGLSPRQALPEAVSTQVQKRMTLALISDAEYLPHLNGLLHNFKEVGESNFSIEVLALDEATEEFVQQKKAEFSLSCHRFDDLWNGVEAPFRQSWSVRDKALRSKPRFLLKLVRAQRDPVLYLDCDLHFRNCPSALLQEFKGNSLLLFPNWNDSPLETKRFGVFNAGMVGARAGSEKFLEVWSELCLKHYQSKGNEGYFVDQGFLDLVPLYSDDFTVYRKGDENVARWNQLTREESAPLRSFHASQPDVKGFYEEKMIWDQAHWLFSSVAPSTWEKRWPRLLENLWRAHILSLSRWCRLSETVAKWSGRDISQSSRAARWVVFGWGRFLLTQIAWARRQFLAEHRAIRRSQPDSWVSEQQLAIRGSAFLRKRARPLVPPFDLTAELPCGWKEQVSTPPSPLDIH